MRSFFYDLNSTNPKQKPQVTDVAAIAQMIEDFIGTRKGQRFFDPNYGVSLSDSLFDLIDTQNALIVFSQLTTQVEENIPVVKVNPLESSIVPNTDNYSYSVVVAYNIDGISETGYTKQITIGGL